MDGKVLCGSNDPSGGHRAVQSFSFFDVARKLILGQISISEKTNEIPVFQQLLKDLEIPNCIFTADALHLQKETFELAKNKHRVLIQLKGNQKSLEEDVLQLIKLEPPTQVYEAPIESEHGRIENRKASVYHNEIENHVLDEQWVSYIKTVVCIERTRQVRDTSTGKWVRSEEKALYLSNETIDAQYAGQLVRGHWGIENSNHYVKDVSFNEDAHKIKKQSFNFSILRSLALNFFRKNKLDNIKHQRYAFSLNWCKLYDYPQVI